MLGDWRRPLAAAAALVAASIVLGAQQTQQQPTFKAITDLVQIDAVVTDQNGKHVRGLKASDFTLLDRGKLQKVETFEEVTHPRPPAVEAARDAVTTPATLDIATNQNGTDDRLIVLLIDDLHLYKERTARAKTIARDVVAKLGPGASMAVLFTSGDRSTEVTQNRRALTDAIETLVGRKPYPRPSWAKEPRETDPSGVGGIQNFYDNLATVRMVREAGKLLKAGKNRRKAFVLLSEWIPQDLSGLYQAGQPAGKVEGGEDYAAGRIEESMKVSRDFATLDYELVDLMDAMRRSNVVIYGIDPRGFVSSQQLMRECHPVMNPLELDPCIPFRQLPDWAAWVRQAQHGLEMSAEASGGFAIVNTDDFTSGLDRILDDLDHYYLLGFYPAEPDKRGYRAVTVKVNGGDLVVRFRQGYESGPPRESAGKKDIDPLMALTTGVVPASTLPLRMTAIPLTTRQLERTTTAPAPLAAAAATRVAVALEVSAAADRLANREGGVADKVRYTVVAANVKDGKVAAQFTNTASVSSVKPITGRPSTFVSYQLPVEFSLRPGRYQLRAAVISETLQESGSVYLTIDVPNLATNQMAMSGLALGFMADARLPIRTTGTVKNPLPFMPTLSREFRAADTLRLYFEIASNLLGGNTTRLTIEMLDADGRAVRSWRPTPVPGQFSFDVPLPLRGIPPGAYTLRASVVAAQRVSRDLALSVR